MADVLAIVSKAVFEKAAGKAPKLGDQLGMDRYVSANKNLAKLADGGRLYLVTVRPPDEALWLVAVLDQPKFSGKEWIAAASTIALTDISALKGQIKFESGNGISAAPGALGMSLQTPRALTAGDVALLDGAVSGTVPPVDTGDAATRGQLVAKILASPADMQARQIYADYLQEQADPRGELIAIELALIGRLSIQKRRNLEARRKELLAGHASGWWPWKITSRHRAGFIQQISGSIGEVLKTAPAIFAAEPVTIVELEDVDEEAAPKLAKAKWLARAERLIVRGGLGDEGFAALIASPHLAGLRSLDVRDNDISAEGLGGLEDRLPGLRHLVLTGNPLGDEGVAALGTWQHLDQLEVLYLGRVGGEDESISTEGLDGLLARPLPRLRRLYLAGNELGDDEVSLLAARAAMLPAIDTLELEGIGNAGAQALASAAFPPMKRVVVSCWSERKALQAKFGAALRG